jgi:hypothetical protein
MTDAGFTHDEFVAQIDEVFASRLSDHRFRPVEESGPYAIQYRRGYQSKTLRVGIGYDYRRSRDLDVVVSKLDSRYDDPSLWDILLGLGAPRDDIAVVEAAAPAPAQVKAQATILAEMLFKYGEPILGGDKSAWKRVMDDRHRRSIELTERYSGRK